MTDTSRSVKSQKGVPSPTSKTAVVSEAEPTEGKKSQAAKEIPVIHDQGFFKHTTGDTYDGEFEAKKKDHSVKMHGQGVYTTAEGDTYVGHWEADKLVSSGETIVSFIDGAKFEGIIHNWGYTGKGKYTYPDGSELTGDFADNCPVGNLVLTDPNGHTWLGKAEHGFGWMEPVNHFYELLDTTQTRIKRRHKNVSNTPTIPGASAPPDGSTSRKPSSVSPVPKTKAKKK